MAKQDNTIQRPVLSASGLKKQFDDGAQKLILFEDLSLEVGVGERVALIGPSGTGKSTLLHMLGALDPNYSGTISIDGRSLESMSDADRAHFRNETLGFVFQSFNLMPHLSVLENVCLPSWFGKGRTDTRRALDLLARVGLKDKDKRKPGRLSGGERQRVAIARALYNKPKLLLCDEPTGNLDAATGQEVLSLFRQLSEDGVSMLVVTHDYEVSHQFAHRSIKLLNGVAHSHVNKHETDAAKGGQ